ncbi:carboxymuconolactone decarboxylase family protein [Chitinophaga silvisoli]|nr:carboxymuconolactone decarboxylase family protein [Chitinophaga silvisoli]
MRIKPLSPDTLGAELRFVHDEITNLVGHSQKEVNMTDTNGGLLGPFAPMLHFPQFGIPALSFLRTLDMNASLAKDVREVAILTVAAAYGAKFELYAHEIMAATFGLSPSAIATLAAGGRPNELDEQQAIAHDVAHALVTGRIVPDSTYKQAVTMVGKEGAGELIFLIAAYCLIALVLNGFDMPAPDNNQDL